MNLDNRSILITGGTGTFGKAFAATILDEFSPDKLIIFSRDEWKQQKMREQFPEDEYKSIRYFIGNVRNRNRLNRAFDNIDYVIHAAALKQVPTAEYNPFEAVQTNVMGAQNVIEAAIDCGVKKVIGLSSDKAANPLNLYGATKLCADKLFTAGNHYSGEGNPTRFSVVRYGNVVGSRGSVIPFFLEKRKNGVLPITDKRMTRFWITLDHAVDLVMTALEKMVGGETFIPKIPSMKITDLAKAIAPNAELKEVGIRPGEKLHEVMIPRNEARNTLEMDDYYVVEPSYHWWNEEEFQEETGGEYVSEDFEFSSDENDRWLSAEELRDMLKRQPHLDFELP